MGIIISFGILIFCSMFNILMKRRTVNVIARCNSMHPIISDGFIVAIDLNEREPRKLQRQIVAARYGDGVTINYLPKNAKEHILGPPAIEEYAPITIPLTAPNPIIGMATRWWARANKR